MTRSIVSRCFYFYFYLLSLLSVASAFNNGSGSGSGNSQHATKRVSIVTGANGYVGREVVKAILLSDGDDGDDKDDNNNGNNNNNNGNNKSKSKKCCNKDEILCLVRSNRVESETEYWKGFRRSSSRPASPTIKVLPYDMLDGGKTIAEALDYVAAEAAAEAEAASDAAAAASEADADRNTPGSSNSSNNSNSNGCSIICVVYHIASVFGPSEDHITTAKDNVRGTRDLVEAVGKFSKSNSKSHYYSSSCCCCCRLVVTSSMAAVRGSGQTPLNGEYYTHEDWNTYSKLGDNWGSSYQWSKMESERIAWEIAREQDISMTSICPSFVFGPPTTTSASASADNNNDNNNNDNDNKEPANTNNNNNNNNLSGSYSITLFGQWIRGESPVQSRLFVDVRDVARAHVLAGTRPKAIGERIIVSTEARIPSQEMAEVLTGVVVAAADADAAAAAAVNNNNKDTQGSGGLVPGNPSRIGFDGDFQGGAIPIGAKEVDSKARLKDILGLTRLTPVHETIRDMGRSLLLQQQVAATTTTTTTTTTVQQQ